MAIAAAWSRPRCRTNPDIVPAVKVIKEMVVPSGQVLTRKSRPGCSQQTGNCMISERIVVVEIVFVLPVIIFKCFQVCSTLCRTGNFSVGIPVIFLFQKIHSKIAFKRQVWSNREIEAKSSVYLHAASECFHPVTDSYGRLTVHFSHREVGIGSVLSGINSVDFRVIGILDG
ncbi:hypothetical protein SDC9_183321 [bioreactor metagenome]|uniref:Uncharacterized protein n=1 Tax=bioreactor metagenome TaxID=1076179 RepID=A0A645HCG9_9ZZZZ